MRAELFSREAEHKVPREMRCSSNDDSLWVTSHKTHDASAATRSILSRELQPPLGPAVSLSGHPGIELPAIRSARIGYKNMRGHLRVASEEGSEQRGMIALIKKVAADEEVKSAEIGIRPRPGGSQELDGRQSVQFCVVT